MPFGQSSGTRPVDRPRAEPDGVTFGHGSRNFSSAPLPTGHKHQCVLRTSLDQPARIQQREVLLVGP